MKKSKATEVVLPLQTALNLPSLSLGTSNSLDTSTKFSPYSQQMTTSSHKESHYLNCVDQQDIVGRLNQILQSLLKEKRELDESRARERQDLEGQVNKRNVMIESLLYDNQGLKEQVEKLSSEVEQKRECVNALKKQVERLQAEKDSLKSVVAYLESKNKEMSFELYELKKIMIRKEGQKKTSLENISQKIPKYLIDQLDQESLFEYTGNFKDMSRQLHRVESMPGFEFVSDVLQGDLPETIVQSGLQSYQDGKNEKGDLSKSNSSRQVVNSSKSAKQGILRKRASICKNQLSKVRAQLKRKGEKEKKEIKTDISTKKEGKEDGEPKKDKKVKK